MRAIAHLLTIFAASCILSGAVVASTDDIDQLLRKAAEGDTYSQYMLGVAYQNGYGVEQNSAEAEKWYKLTDMPWSRYAPRARYNRASMYYSGHGVPQDHAEAASLMLDAAHEGLADAQNAMGFLFLEGHGVPQNYQEALMWYQRAADQGHAGAQKSIENLHGRGIREMFAATSEVRRQLRGQEYQPGGITGNLAPDSSAQFAASTRDSSTDWAQVFGLLFYLSTVLFFSYLVGNYAKRKGLGFGLHMALSFILSPLIMALVVWMRSQKTGSTKAASN